jgi:hypothetical protein
MFVEEQDELEIQLNENELIPLEEDTLPTLLSVFELSAQELLVEVCKQKR